MILFDPKNREEWLECRKSGIGGSDAGCVVGKNKYKSNLTLYNEKTGAVQPEDISDNIAVKFGKNAEEHIRVLFALTYPEFDIDYHEFRMYANDKYPFIYATLDGELADCKGRQGILEIKTVTIRNSEQWEEWNDRIPDSYYIQILHQLIATGWDFAVLYAHIRYSKGNEVRATMRRYDVERNEVVEDMQILLEAEKAFWKNVEEKKIPALILPEI